MWKDKSPGVKILWIWTLGTAAILLTSVGRTRMKDMQQIVNSQEQPKSQADEFVKADDPMGSADNAVREDKF